jgi:hypothetical protein
MATVQELLDSLQEREVDRLDAKKLDLTEKIYPNMPEVIKRTSEVTGIPEEMLVRACVRAAWNYRDMEWHMVMDIIRSFYLAKRNIENKES